MRTKGEIVRSLRKYRRQNNNIMNGIVLDLRGNGRSFGSGSRNSRFILDGGVVIKTVGEKIETEYADAENTDILGCPIVILIEEWSFLSEILAGALQDRGRAVLIGSDSYGKGSVQTIYELPFSTALKLTIAKYFTPAGYSIQGTGIAPDLRLYPIDARAKSRIKQYRSLSLNSEK